MNSGPSDWARWSAKPASRAPARERGIDPLEPIGRLTRACLEKKLLLTRYSHERVHSLGFEVGPEPELTVRTYRWVPERADPDVFNEALVRANHRVGRVFVSSTGLGRHYFLRLAMLSFRTQFETVELTLRVLAERAARFESGGSFQPTAGKR